jgi:DNA-binding IclR family transcriptional regulator
MPSASDGQQTPAIQSLDRGLIILEAVARSSDPISLGALTAILGIDRSSVFRLANTLKRRGFLAYPAGRKDYILGPSVWRLSRQYDWGGMLISVSQEQLKLLAAQSNETAHLAVREGRHALFIDHARTTNIIAVSGQTGELVPLYCTAHGKALLADLDALELKALFGSARLKSFTPNTITSIEQLAKICIQIKARGYAEDDEEYQKGIRCAAAPIRAAGGVIVGSIGISAPISRVTKERHKVLGDQVRRIASNIEKLLANQVQEA